MGLLNTMKLLFGRNKVIVRDWDDPLDIAVTTLPEVVSGEREVLVVLRDEGIGGGLGGWTFLDGYDLAGRSPIAVAKTDLLSQDPTLTEITDLPVGWEATRSKTGEPWFRKQSDK